VCVCVVWCVCVCVCMCVHTVCVCGVCVCMCVHTVCVCVCVCVCVWCGVCVCVCVFIQCVCVWCVCVCVCVCLLTFPPMVQKVPVAFLRKGHQNSTHAKTSRESCPETQGTREGDVHGLPKALTCVSLLGLHVSLTTSLIQALSPCPHNPHAQCQPEPWGARPWEVLLRRLHWHYHCVFPFHLSRCPMLSSLYMGHFPSPGPFSVPSCIPHPSLHSCSLLDP
jgi:hypothetical protein